MKAFTVVKKSELWLECDVWKCFLMPACADSAAFKSRRGDAGSLLSKICGIDSFTSTNSPLGFFSPLSFFPKFFLWKTEVKRTPCAQPHFKEIWTTKLPQRWGFRDDQTLNLKLLNKLLIEYQKEKKHWVFFSIWVLSQCFIKNRSLCDFYKALLLSNGVIIMNGLIIHSQFPYGDLCRMWGWDETNSNTEYLDLCKH